MVVLNDKDDERWSFMVKVGAIKEDERLIGGAKEVEGGPREEARENKERERTERWVYQHVGLICQIWVVGRGTNEAMMDGVGEVLRWRMAAFLVHDGDWSRSFVKEIGTYLFFFLVLTLNE